MLGEAIKSPVKISRSNRRVGKTPADGIELDVEGDVHAQSFVGDGAGLTSVSAVSVPWAGIPDKPAAFPPAEGSPFYLPVTGGE